MSTSSSETTCPNIDNAIETSKYKGIRRRKWGKWVSEIRVPGTRHRLWLGSYATPEAAAVAHDVACYCLQGDSSSQKLNFPAMLPASATIGLSPPSIQKVASDAGLAVDARLLDSKKVEADERELDRASKQENFNLSVEDYL